MRIGMSIGSWIYNISDKKIYADPLTCSFFDIDYLEGERGLPLQRYIDAMHSGDQERVRVNAQRDIRDGRCRSEIFRVSSLSGGSRFIMSGGNFYCDSQGNPILCSGYTVDIGVTGKSSYSIEDLREHLEVVFMKSSHLNVPMIKYFASMALLEIDDICKSTEMVAIAATLN